MSTYLEQRNNNIENNNKRIVHGSEFLKLKKKKTGYCQDYKSHMIKNMKLNGYILSSCAAWEDKRQLRKK